MTLMDERIVRDLRDLYHGGATPGDIRDALLLDGLVRAENGQRSFATRAFPHYFAGDRKAKTVMVMLNPGYDVEKANQNLMHDLELHAMRNANDIENYYLGRKNFGHIDKKRKDNFDVKEAFFLHKWENTGISLPRNLCSDSDEKTLLNAKEIILTQKLRLELIPYPSRSISRFNPQMVHLLVPFVETLFDEIFSCERKCVIFCSRKFHNIFKAYNGKHPNAITFDKENIAMGKIGDSKVTGSCSIVTIHYKEKSLKALIANTFPHRALPNAYRLMELYGEFCFHEYTKR